MNDVINAYIAEFQQLEAGLPGQQYAQLSNLRANAINYLKTKGFPTKRDEAWKYTRVDAMTAEHYPTTVTAPLLADFDLQPYLIAKLSGYRCVFINGVFQTALSNIQELTDGLVIMPLVLAITDFPNYINNELTRFALSSPQHAFTALNDALWQDGIIIHLQQDCHLVEPIEVIFINTADSTQTSTQLRNYILLDENASAQIIFRHHSEDKCFTNMTTQVSLSKKSSCTYYNIQQESKSAFHVHTVSVEQAEQSEFNSHSYALGARLARSDIEVKQNGVKTRTTLYGLFHAGQDQHIDHHTRIEHASNDGFSNEFYKGLLQYNGRGVFNAHVRVAADATNNEAHQLSRNLLLSDDAEIDTQPILEIYNDDVRCSHGATVGQIDEDAIFYLRSRGLSEQQARNALLKAFNDEILDKIPLLALKQYIDNLLHHSQNTEAQELVHA